MIQLLPPVTWTHRRHQRVRLALAAVLYTAFALALAAVATSARANGCERLVAPGWLLPAVMLRFLLLSPPQVSG